MKQLSGLDATFLYLETPEMPMHVGALHLYELPPASRASFVTALRHHMASGCRHAGAAPQAVVDAAEPGQPGLGRCRARPARAHRRDQAAQGRRHGRTGSRRVALHPVLLDRKRPLWKFHVFEGLAPGPNGEPRVALYTQLHHAAVDGQAAVALANAILDLTPRAARAGAQALAPQKVFKLDMTEMLRGRARQPGAEGGAHRPRSLPSTVGTLKDAATAWWRTRRCSAGKARGSRQPDAGAAHAAERVGHRRPRLCQRDAAAARAEGLGRRTAPPSTTWC
jgi:diacylglycerol O-acyltransferase